MRSQLNKVSVAFNVNLNGLNGLGATLSSLLRNCSDIGRLNLYFLCTDLAIEDEDAIKSLLKKEGIESEPIFLNYDAVEKFGHLASLYGDFTTYGKSLIPELIPDRKVLYLDSDLVVNTDVIKLFEELKGEYPICAVTTSPVRIANDGPFLINKMGFPAEMMHFNAGVMLFDNENYKSWKMAEKWDRVCARYPKLFVSADQTVFNAICGGDFGRLPAKYNRPWLPGQSMELLKQEDCIIHFVGSPKPWDGLGITLHEGHKLWRSYTSEAWYERYCRVSSRQVARMWYIRRSIFRHSVNYFRGLLSFGNLNYPK